LQAAMEGYLVTTMRERGETRLENLKRLRWRGLIARDHCPDR
jgi:hypothetical protein